MSAIALVSDCELRVALGHMLAALFAAMADRDVQRARANAEVPWVITSDAVAEALQEVEDALVAQVEEYGADLDVLVEELEPLPARRAALLQLWQIIVAREMEAEHPSEDEPEEVP